MAPLFFQVAAARDKAEAITITMPDGAERKGVRGVTTPMDVANEVSKSLGKNSVVAKVDGEIWDLFRPLEKDCRLELFPFDTPEGREVSSLLVLHQRTTLLATIPVLRSSSALGPYDGVG
jgi:hypothetical protein